jgi:hypothetical protein
VEPLTSQEAAAILANIPRWETQEPLPPSEGYGTPFGG